MGSSDVKFGYGAGRGWWSVCILAALVLFVGGCDEKEDARPDKIVLRGESCRYAALDVPQKIQLNVFAETVKTALGGSKEILAAGVNVSYSIVEAPAGSTASLTQDEPKTDAGGYNFAWLANVNKPGVYRVRIALKDYPGVKPAIVTYYGGISIEGSGQDGLVKSSLDKPIIVHAESAPGVPLKGVELSFDLRHAPSGTRILQSKGVTGEDGTAKLEVKLGKKQGGGVIGLRVMSEPWSSVKNLPDLRADFFVIDGWGLALGIFGGLAIFIFGMRQMSEGLSLIAGDKLRSLLHFLTRNRFAAVGMGAVITGFIQSSSACSVMVIGFVNAGLMRLEQAIGVIMGANIGTTVTAQMLSFKLSQLALPAIAIGVIILLLAKRSGLRFFAQILIGFGLLFLGMQMMSAPLKELKGSATIHGFFEGLSCAPQPGNWVVSLLPFVKAIAAGTLVTVIVQSSSAAIGLLLTLAGAGLLDVYTAFAILLGDNIGTTITAVLASIGSSKTAKRTACAHVTFNVVGTIVMIILMYVPWNGHPVFMELINKMTPGDAFNNINLPRFLANAHTAFNISCTAVFIWFVGPLAWFTRKVVPGEDELTEEGTMRGVLDSHLLATPALAIVQAWREVGVMLKLGRDSITVGGRAIFDTSVDFQSVTDQVKELEQNVDKMQSAITDYVTNISQEVLTKEQSVVLPRLLHSVNDAERVGDHSMHLLRLAKRVRKRDLSFTEEAKTEINTLHTSLQILFDCCDRILGSDQKLPDAELEVLVRKAMGEAKNLKRLAGDFRKNHVDRHESEGCEIRSGVIFLESIQNITRVGGHLMNIIQAAVDEKFFRK